MADQPRHLTPASSSRRRHAHPVQLPDASTVPPPPPLVVAPNRQTSANQLVHPTLSGSVGGARPGSTYLKDHHEPYPYRLADFLLTSGRQFASWISRCDYR